MIHISYNPFIYKHASGTQIHEMAVSWGFCASFHASSYCMLAEITTALMFQNFYKYVIFNKVAL